jgi:hypothetical protein
MKLGSLRVRSQESEMILYLKKSENRYSRTYAKNAAYRQGARRYAPTNGGSKVNLRKF